MKVKKQNNNNNREETSLLAGRRHSCSFSVHRNVLSGFLCLPNNKTPHSAQQIISFRSLLKVKTSHTCT